MKNTNEILGLFKDSIFGVMSKLARENNAINLSQGFPDFDGEEWVKQAACEKIQQGFNQYAPFPGTANLLSEVSNYYKKFYDLNYDPATEITITAGATEALYLAIHALLNPGDEAIVLEPFYDSYVTSIRTAHATPVPVTLHAPSFSFDIDELEKAMTTKTKLLIFNNPHNPSGKMFSKDEILTLCNFVKKHDLYLISDEVYEFLSFDGNVHIPSATIQDMKERTITISSAGKTFGLTGWKIGWTCAPKEITHKIRLLHQYVTFSVSTPMQEAVAHSLTKLEAYLPQFRKLYQAKRDNFYTEMQKLGFDFPKPQGTYFMMVPIHHKTKLNDVDYAMKLVTERKVATVPPSAFYLKSEDGKKYLRFCFAKKEETLKMAIQNLHGL
jgi:aspartate/methionine/tyrosine aminotransferase